MERPESIKPRPPGPLKGEHREAIKLIIIFHLIGLIGFLIPALNSIFLKLVPWHLLFMFGILVFSYRHIDKKFILFILLTYLLGYVAEWIGVNQHWLFGNYSYGTTLGIIVCGVPLIIGINWILLTWSAGVLMQRTKLNNPALRIIAGSLLLVLLDLLIEPVAVHFNYWHWTENTIPLENYVCWFLLSGLILALFELFRFRKQSMVAPVFLAVEFVFFTILYFAVR